MPVIGDDDEEPPFRPLTPEQQAAIEARARKAKERKAAKEACSSCEAIYHVAGCTKQYGCENQ